MNKEELNILVNNELITDIGYIDDLISDSSKLENLTPEDMASYGFLSQPSINNVIKEEGIMALTPIKTQQDLEERIKLGKKIKLTNDLRLDTCIIINPGDVCDIDLNGYTIIGGLFTESGGTIKEGSTDSYTFWNKGGKLIISGEGNVVASFAKYSMAVWTQDGITILNGGVYENFGEGCDLIYASKTGSVEINGGIYLACTRQEGVPGTKNLRSALNVKDVDYKKGTADIKVMGGKFLEFDPANNVSEGENTNFVAEGFKSVLNNDTYHVIEI